MPRVWPYALVGLLYLATSPYHEGLNNPNEMVRVYAAVAFAEEGSFEISEPIRRWGGVDDKARIGDRVYSSKAPWQTLVAIPGAAVAEPLLTALGYSAGKRNTTFVLRILSSVIPSLLFSWWLMAWCRRRAVELEAPPSLGMAVGLSLALGTMLYPYALTVTGHGWAGIGAGGCYLLLIGLARHQAQEPGWRGIAVAMGALGAMTPFAEYPATLAVAPILLTAVWITPRWLRRAELVGWMGLGGLIPMALGLWAHGAMWGSPFKTGYSFLDNPAYRTLHGEGFFGVGLPSPTALWGALFSVETGLFVFSPVLLVGLAMMVLSAFPRQPDEDTAGIRRHQQVALAGLTSITLMFLFIASHSGWRGGWTVGPRYILPVAPVLGVWVVEALAIRRLWASVVILGVLSLAVTGLSGSLYPHLSDVYTNPWASFVVPSYLEGLSTYGLAYMVGLRDGAANVLHLAGLLAAAIAILTAGTSARDALRVAPRRLAWVAAGLMVLALMPERNPAAALAETSRLWNFWEPRGGQVERPRRPEGRLGSLRQSIHRSTVTATHPDGSTRTCGPGRRRCSYGDAEWQRYGVDRVRLAGVEQPGIHMHPVGDGGQVQASFPVPDGATRWVVYAGLTDGSIGPPQARPGCTPDVTVRQGERPLGTFTLRHQPGWQRRTFDLTDTASVSLSVKVRDDGNCTFVFDGDFFDASASQ